MEKAKVLELDRSEGPYRQLFVFTDELNQGLQQRIEELGKKRTLSVAISRTTFSGVGENIHNPEFYTRVTVAVSGKPSIGDKLTDRLEGAINSIIAIVPGRCAVYDSSAQLYYQETSQTTSLMPVSSM